MRGFVAYVQSNSAEKFAREDLTIFHFKFSFLLHRCLLEKEPTFVQMRRYIQCSLALGGGGGKIQLL